MTRCTGWRLWAFSGALAAACGQHTPQTGSVDAGTNADGGTDASVGDGSTSTDAAGIDAANVDAAPKGVQLLGVSSNKRYLVDGNGKPFYLVGDTAWCLLPGISVTQASSYFQTRASQGYNAVLVDADVQLGASPVGAPSRGPQDVNGNEPFNGKLSGGDYDVSTVPAAGDTTSTAAKYWANVDAILLAASHAGIQIIFDVYDNYNPWFGGSSSPNSTDKLKAYGEFLGARYVGFDNIVWMLGNDYNESTQGDANLLAVMEGIREYDTRHLGWAIDEYGAGFDNKSLRSDFSVNSIYEYSAGPWRTLYLGQYNRADFGPIVNIESGYENNSSLGVSLANVREEHYSFLLSGATGDTYGNEYVWPFADAWQSWQDALTSEGAKEVGYFAKLVGSIDWTALVPDQNGTVFQGVGSPEDYCGAYSTDGKWAVAYRPSTGQSAQNFTVNLGKLSGQVNARWYDPTAGTYATIGSFANSGTHTFNSPSSNAAGQNDYVLVLETQ